MKCDEIDSQILAENVSFLDKCFENTFNLNNSLHELKGFLSEQRNSKSENKAPIVNKSKTANHSKISFSQNLNGENNIQNKRDVTVSSNEDFKKNLSNWGLPIEIVSKYSQKGINTMFQWQVECLCNPKVLLECKNLVYSAPTSAGKTLVAEILTIKTILERQKKVIIILPFVSIVREKMFYLQNIFASSGIRVEGFMGSQSPPGGLQSVHVAICTIEKANSLVNRMLDDNSIVDLGALVVDELHLLGDPHRGYILELLLTKVKYISSKMDDVKIQIIGMSATLPNLEVLSNWLDAELYVTDFRPIPLDEYCLVENKYYNKERKCVGAVAQATMNNQGDSVLNICLETIKTGCSVLIFCMTKNRCENLAQSIASSFFKLGCSGEEIGVVLRQQLKTDNISEVLEQLQNCPVGLDHILKNVISFGVAYHHAGLTFDERDIIEGAFKSGAIRVLVATSTLSSGVNLPARKVVIRSPVFQRQPINILTYKQMVGRAGRMGQDSKGESILVCTEAEKKTGFDLMLGDLDPVRSCIEGEDKFMRAVLEMIASQVVCTKSELNLYSNCTLLFYQEPNCSSQNALLNQTLKQLLDFELIRMQKDGDEENYKATSLGKACLSSSMAPNDGLSLFCELQKARQCIVLETDLHLIYMVTPYSVSSQWADLDWLHLLTLWESLTVAMRRVGELVGVQERFIIRCLRGGNKAVCKTKLNIHKRFYTALALQDLVNEVPLSEVASKFQCARGFLQGLQQAAATFAGMVTAFCRQLGWKNMELLVSQFQDRLNFGVHSELLELMKLTSLNGVRARTLFNSGFETIASIASADVNVIEAALQRSVPFQSEKLAEGDDVADVRKRNKIRNIWITGFCGMTTKEAAENLIMEARKYLELEIGGAEIKWDIKSSLHSVVEEDKQKVSQNPKTTTTNEIETVVPEPDPIIITNNAIGSDNGKTKNNTENTIINKISDTTKNICSENVKKDVTTLKTSEPDVVWDTLQINETAFNNISKIRLSANVLSPNISFGEFEDNLDFSNTSLVMKSGSSKSVKDVSLFSSEGESPSLFEDSLPLDLIPVTAIETSRKLQCKDKNESRTIEYSNINVTSIIEAFNETLLNGDEDIKLHYEVDANDAFKVDGTTETSQRSSNNFEEIEEISTQEADPLVVKEDFISPLKRRQKISQNASQPDTKKKKLKSNKSKSFLKLKAISNNRKIQLRSSKSIYFNMQIEKETFECYILKENDCIDNLESLDSGDVVSMMTLINDTKTEQTKTIGSGIVKESFMPKKSEELPYGIIFYLDRRLCIFFDLSNLNNFHQFTYKIKKFLMKPKIVTISVKSQYLCLKKLLGCEVTKIFSHVLVSEWLIQNEEGSTSVRELAKKYCDVDFLKTKIIINDVTKGYDQLDKVEDACLKAWCVYNIAEKQQNVLLDRYQFASNVTDIENRVLKILAHSENQGIRVDKELASQLLIDVKSSQEVLQKKAFKICGYHFNFNSSKDVAKVLGIYKGRKVSTKKSVLTAHNSAMASIVIYWRKLNSILTKTLYPLTEKAYMYSKDNRINPSYTMFTCTGRISMHEPNLQNVPRTFTVPINYLKDIEPCDDVIEFNCRNIFQASPGCVFVSADYCQLEMRILTHYSGDAVLTRIMSSDVDVFKSIAASWGGIPETEVDDDLRQKAKQLCYGILYGMGNRTLSQLLDVSEMEAAVFMDSFYKTYPNVKIFTQSVITECRSKGYVETLMKRRRYLPDINSLVPSRRSTAERQAVNTTIQGSAADIAKAAMCAIDAKYDQPHLVLQMHDELIYEVPETKKNEFIRVLKEIMETTVSLNVPLPVKVRCGYTWGTLEEVKFK